MVEAATMSDLSRLEHLTEGSVLKHLKERFTKDLIYTFLGDVLVAINPYKQLNIYGSEAHVRYKLGVVDQDNDLPHVYSVARQSYDRLLRTQQSQCVLVSGESGTGKTESTKFFIDHLSYLCQADGSEQTELREKVTRINPLLEAFGNAVTPMNPNSSRFGKLIELTIDSSGKLIGAKIKDYLLEKSRVASQGQGERNFHIFYYIFAGLTKEQKSYFNLASVDQYRILSHGREPAFPHSSVPVMRKRFSELMELMASVGFDHDDTSTVLAVLAGILHLTNIIFRETWNGSEGVEVTPGPSLTAAASLLGVPEHELADILTSNSICVRGENVRTNKKLHQADDSRDALAKALYSRLFGWIVGQINNHLQPGTNNGSDIKTLSILDFSGFEKLQRNHFDQLCINAANERLHQYLCHHIFNLEAADLRSEGVDADQVNFKDNQAMIDLLFQKPHGLFYLLDEESSFPQATDQTLVAKLDAVCSSNDHYLPARGNPYLFTIDHYAGQVVYDASGMLERNRDTLGSNMAQLMLNSNSEMTRMLFKAKGHATGSYSRSFSEGKLRPSLHQQRDFDTNRTAGSFESASLFQGKSHVTRYFRKSLHELVQKLETCHPWFIRCVRPNARSAPGVFDSELVTHQLRCNGLLEIAKIRRDGYPIRIDFKQFVHEFRDICFDGRVKLSGTRQESETILYKCNVTEFAVGHSKVFLKQDQRRILEVKLDETRREVERRRKADEELERRKLEEKRKAGRERQAKVEEEKMKASAIAFKAATNTSGQGQKKTVGFTHREDISISSSHQKVQHWIDMNDVVPDEAASSTLSDPPIIEQPINTPDPPDMKKETTEALHSPLLDRTQWDRFQIVPRDTYQDKPSNMTGIKALKIFCYFLIGTIVLGAAVLNKVAMLTLTSSVVKHTTAMGSSPQPTLVLLAMCFPYVCNALAYGSRSLFGSSGWPGWKMTFGMLAVELCHTSGLCLLVFRVLPQTDMMRGIILMTSIYAMPAFLKLCSAHKSKTDGRLRLMWTLLISGLSLLIQAASITYCSLNNFTFSEQERKQLIQKIGSEDYKDLTLVRSIPEHDWSFRWEVPAALLLISVGFWENYLETDVKICGWVLRCSRWKKDIHLVRQRMYIFLSMWKIIWSILFAVLMVNDFDFSVTFPLDEAGAAMDPVDRHVAQYAPLYVCLLTSVLCTYFSGLACKLHMQRIAFSLPMTLVTPLSAGLIYFGCTNNMFSLNNVCYHWVCQEAWRFDSLYHTLLLAGTWLSQTLIVGHLWLVNSERMAKTDKLFITPMRCSVLLEQTLMLRRRTPKNETSLQKSLEDPRFRSSAAESPPQIYACATMWHETRSEMTKLLKSIFRMDIDHSARAIAQKYYKIQDPDYYEFEAHIFFDDAFELSETDDLVPNSFVQRFVECLDEAISSVHERPTSMIPPERSATPYGGRLTWSLPGGTTLVVHLKDKDKIRNRKRWSQVMYLYYLLGYNILAGDDGPALPVDLDGDNSNSLNGLKCEKMRLTSSQLRKRRRSAFFSRSVLFNHVTEDVQSKAENTYLLTLDGDVDFRPEAVRLLVDRMQKNKKVGAACGRIHPIGSGPIVWYQQFEYAIGHWLQKATEHVFGCVLCAPGCFSLYRGSALMDDNVAKMYATKSTEAGHYVQFDQGEDRWLSTLLLQQGYRIDYSAAADAFTQAPETFDEFFNQRRRWGPSTLANIMDLLGDWRNTVHMNDNISSLYVFYQTMMFVSTLLGPATVLLMMAGAYQVVFKITVFESYCLSTIPAIGYVLLCMFSRCQTQLSVGAVMSAVYAIVMTVVLVGTVGTAISGSITSPNVIFMVMLGVIFITSGFMHPRELGCLVPGVLYFICIPAGYLVLTIYFLCNLHVVSWGTREVPMKKTKEELEKEKLVAEEKKQRKEERKKGLFGWLGLRHIMAEVGEIIHQFRSLLFETKNKSERSPNRKDTKRKRSSSQTNELLQQLIEEFKTSKKAPTHEDDARPNDFRHSVGMNDPPKRLGTETIVILESDVRDASRNDTSRSVRTDSKEQNKSGIARSSGHPQSVVTHNSSLRQDPTRPSWIHHPCLGDGPIKQLPERERVFWNQLVSRYLYPITEDKEHQEKIRKDLLALRNNVVFAFFMTSAVWIALFMQLEILQNELKDHLFVHIPRIDGDGYLSFQPLGLIFLGCFSIILLLQYTGMFAHRWGTVLHTLSVTDIGLGQRLKEQDKVKDIILRVSQLQKLRNIEMEPEPDYEEPLPDYVEEEASLASDLQGHGTPVEMQTFDGPRHQSTPQPHSQGYRHLSGQYYGDQLARLEAGTPSMPPSYHTQENPHAPTRTRRRDVFDRSGYPHAFALENAFERRFRNEMQHHRGTYGRSGLPGFSEQSDRLDGASDFSGFERHREPNQSNRGYSRRLNGWVNGSGRFSYLQSNGRNNIQ